MTTGGTAYTGSKPAEVGELVPGTLVGEYRIEGTLGEGGMGRVYSAIHPVIAKRAAIKVLHPQLSMDEEAIQRFAQEARSVNQIGHPNIVDIFAFGALPDGRQYFVMEWLRGRSLRDQLELGVLPLDQAIQFIETITLPLEAAHEQGIIHRDLKPDNVFLVEVKGDRPTIKLLDFGIAKLAGPDKITNTRTGNMLGTPAYCSPEQARGEGVDHRTDIYALGAMLFELLTGEMVFSATNVADMISKQLFEQPRAPSSLNPSVPRELDALTLAMLSKEATHRPSLEGVRVALRACRHALGAVTPIHGIPVQSSPQITPPQMPYMTPYPQEGTTGAPVARSVITTSAPKRSKRGIVIGFACAAAAGFAIIVGTGAFDNTKNSGKIEAKPAEIQPKPDPKPDTKAAAQPDTKPVDTKAKVDPVAVDTQPIDTKPDSKPIDTKTVDVKLDSRAIDKKIVKRPKPDPKAKPDPKTTVRPDAGSATPPRDPDAPL